MKAIDKAIHEIHRMDHRAGQGGWLHGIHPLAKLLVTVFYIALVMSFAPYDLMGVSAMVLYPLILSITGEISLRESLYRIRLFLLLAAAVGIANPVLDKTVLFQIGTVTITGGMVSMITLMLKGSFAVLASYLLILTTSMEKICYALRLLHVPKVFVTMLLLIYRYLIVLLKEAEKMEQAYLLRAPGHKGIQLRAWGPLAGQLLLRSMDRAQAVYESMVLRGYKGEFYVQAAADRPLGSVVYFLLCILALLTLRIVPVFQLAGKLL